MRQAIAEATLPIGALIASLLLFGVFVWLGGVSPVETWTILFKGAFGDWFSWQNTLQRAAPLMLTALCVAIPARAGLIIIGGEGAFVLGGLACAAVPYLVTLPANAFGTTLVCIAGMLIGGLWIALAGALRQYRGVNETISSLLLAYTAIAIFKQLVEGPLRDPATLNKPSTRSLVEGLRITGIGGSDVHWGLVLGIAACLLIGLWLAYTASGFSVRVVGGNPRTAQLVGLPANRLVLLACAIGGACAGPGRRGRGRRGPHQRERVADRRLRLRRHPGRVHRAPVAVRDHPGRDPVRRLRRRRQPAAAPARPAGCVGAGAAGHRVRADPRQRGAARARLDRHPRQAAAAAAARPAAEGHRWAAGDPRDRGEAGMSAPARSLRRERAVARRARPEAEHAARARTGRAAPARALRADRRDGPQVEGAAMTADIAVAFLAAIIGGALRVGVPFLFVSLGECLTEKSGRINLGLEGVLVLSAMAGFGGAYLTGSPWAGVALAALAGAALALLHGLLCSLPRVNDVATGIALMLLGTGLAFYLGKPLIQPQAPQLPPIALGGWSGSQVVQAALQVNPLLPLGIALAAGDALGLRAHALGAAGAPRGRFGERDQGARLFGQRRAHRRDDRRRRDRRPRRRLADLVLSGQLERGHLERPGPDRGRARDLRALEPWRCVGAALLFGGAGAIGPALQSIGISQGYYLFGAVPYVLTLVILVISCRPGSVARGSPGELSSVR
jgi:ABC-type uncharacterized transport system permease subunit